MPQGLQGKELPVIIDRVISVVFGFKRWDAYYAATIADTLKDGPPTLKAEREKRQA